MVSSSPRDFIVLCFTTTVGSTLQGRIWFVVIVVDDSHRSFPKPPRLSKELLNLCSCERLMWKLQWRNPVEVVDQTPNNKWVIYPCIPIGSGILWRSMKSSTTTSPSASFGPGHGTGGVLHLSVPGLWSATSMGALVRKGAGTSTPSGWSLQGHHIWLVWYRMVF